MLSGCPPFLRGIFPKGPRRGTAALAAGGNVDRVVPATPHPVAHARRQRGAIDAQRPRLGSSTPDLAAHAGRGFRCIEPTMSTPSSAAMDPDGRHHLAALLEAVFAARHAEREQQRGRGVSTMDMAHVRRETLRALEEYATALERLAWPVPRLLHQQIQLHQALLNVRTSPPRPGVPSVRTGT